MTPPIPCLTDHDSASTTSRRRPHVLLLMTAIFAIAVYGVSCDVTPPVSAAAAPSFTFTGSGWGHGVGMSQWGARGMAANGSTFDQILTYYYTGTAVSTRATSNDLRVLATEKQATLIVTAVGGPVTLTGVGTIPAGRTVTITRSGSAMKVTGALTTTTSADLSFSYAGASIKLSSPGYTYRYGRVVVRPDSAGGVRAIVADLPMQQYLYGLGEMSSSWPTEAIKAQATASRTFAQKKRDGRKTADFDLYGSIYHQAYTGTKWEDSAWQNAVNSTNNRLVTHNGTLIDALYSASSGGHTENSEIVWVSPVAYLKGKPDPYDGTGGNPHASWTRTYTGSQLGSWFGLGTVTSVQILGNTGTSGRVDKATIRLVGTGGTKDVPGLTFRSTVNSKFSSSSSQLMSTKFIVK